MHTMSQFKKYLQTFLKNVLDMGFNSTKISDESTCKVNQKSKITCRYYPTTKIRDESTCKGKQKYKCTCIYYPTTYTEPQGVDTALTDFVGKIKRNLFKKCDFLYRGHRIACILHMNSSQFY